MVWSGFEQSVSFQTGNACYLYLYRDEYCVLLAFRTIEEAGSAILRLYQRPYEG